MLLLCKAMHRLTTVERASPTRKQPEVREILKPEIATLFFLFHQKEKTKVVVSKMVVSMVVSPEVNIKGNS
jgi:hypothetical protein